MAYKKDQGRYARMGAFWALFALLAYGCLGGLVGTLRRWMAPKDLGERIEPFVENLPLLGDIDTPMLLSLAVLAVGGFVIYSLLNRPSVADMLIGTEAELKKVTWPSAGETWSGTIAVIVTVVVLLGYLYIVDYGLGFVLHGLLQRGSA